MPICTRKLYSRFSRINEAFIINSMYLVTQRIYTEQGDKIQTYFLNLETNIYISILCAHYIIIQQYMLCKMTFPKQNMEK